MTTFFTTKFSRHDQQVLGKLITDVLRRETGCASVPGDIFMETLERIGDSLNKACEVSCTDEPKQLVDDSTPVLVEFTDSEMEELVLLAVGAVNRETGHGIPKRVLQDVVVLIGQAFDAACISITCERFVVEGVLQKRVAENGDVEYQRVRAGA